MERTDKKRKEIEKDDDNSRWTHLGAAALFFGAIASFAYLSARCVDKDRQVETALELADSLEAELAELQGKSGGDNVSDIPAKDSTHYSA